MLASSRASTGTPILVLVASVSAPAGWALPEVVLLALHQPGGGLGVLAERGEARWRPSPYICIGLVG